MKKRFTEQNTAFASHLTTSGTPPVEITRKTGASKATFYRWRPLFADMGVIEIGRLKALEFHDQSLCLEFEFSHGRRFHLPRQRSREEYIVFQMNVLMQ